MTQVVATVVTVLKVYAHCTTEIKLSQS